MVKTDDITPLQHARLLAYDGVPESSENKLMLCRILAAAAENPDVTLTVKDLSRATNLTERTVASCLASQEMDLVWSVHLQNKALGLLAKGLGVAERIMNNESSSDTVKLRAVSVAKDVYASVMQHRQQDTSADAEQEVRQLIKMIQPKIKIENPHD